jgi:hypothetical protein
MIAIVVVVATSMWGVRHDGGVLTLPIMTGTLMIAAAAMLAMIVIMTFMDIMRPQRRFSSPCPAPRTFDSRRKAGPHERPRGGLSRPSKRLARRSNAGAAGDSAAPQVAFAPSWRDLRMSDNCGVRTHALADWRLEPAP